MKIVEYRIISPISYAAFQYASMYMVARRAREESDGHGEGIELVTMEPYDNEAEHGIYAHKIYHYRSRVPRWLRWAVPASLTDFNEQSWAAYPHAKCVYFIPGFGSRFHLQIESFSYPYSREVAIGDNPGHLTPEDLAIREIHYMDIIKSLPKPDRPDWELAGFECPEAGIQKLAIPTAPFDSSKPPEWTETYSGPMVVSVKVVKASVQIWGLQTKLERFAACELIPSVLLGSARGVVGWASDWARMTNEEIERYAEEINAEVNASIVNAEPCPVEDQRPEEKEELE